MNPAQFVKAGVIAGAALMAVIGCGAPTSGEAEVSPADSPAEAPGAQSDGEIPIFTYDPTWPRMPLPEQWTLGNVTGVTVDSEDHVWILQRPYSITHGSEDGLEHDPPLASAAGWHHR